MSFRQERICTLFLVGIMIFCFNGSLYAQRKNQEELNKISKKFGLRQDSINQSKKRVVQMAEPDTNFTWEKYAGFLKIVSDTSKYIVLPVNEFRKTFNNNKIVIGLRHDVDLDLNLAYKFSSIESDLGFRSTYFILHSAPYYLKNANNMEVHNEEIIPILKSMQDEKHFEIGWHNDLVTLQVIYNINPVNYFHKELDWLRSNGLNIYGTAAHGSNNAKTYHYVNFYFFEECTFPALPGRENNISVPKDVKVITLIKGKLSDFNLQYEAYFLNNNKAYSDATITNGIRWNIGMLDLSQLIPGDRAIILLHPTHWHKGSVHANIESFSIPGQKSCTIDSIKSKIIVDMPAGTNKSSLIASYSLSPGAYVKVSGKLQINRGTQNNFNEPVIYKVFAENRSIQRNWTVEIHILKSQANFVSFSVPGMIGPAIIDTIGNSIIAEIETSRSIDSLKPTFELSDKAKAWIGKKEQLSDLNFTDFSRPVFYDIVSSDSQKIKKWRATIVGPNDNYKSEKPAQTGLLIYPNPTDGKTQLQFVGVTTSPTTLDIFNTMGEKVFTRSIKKTGAFTVEEDLKKLRGGIYIVRFSEVDRPEIIVIKKH